jgi:hypothetical protein
MKILVNGCSFTSGEESPIAWPQLIPDTVNIAVPGASNDYILHSTVHYIKNTERPTHVIIAWTSPNRIEISGKHLTPTSEGKYGQDVIQAVFNDWDILWARSKFLSQIELLHSYLKCEGIPHLFVSAFDIQSWVMGDPPAPWLGWPRSGMVEWMWDCPKGAGGHPLELGHQRIAEKINEHIRHLGWIP